MDNTFKLFDYRVYNHFEKKKIWQHELSKPEENVATEYFRTVPDWEQTSQGLKDFCKKKRQSAIDNKSFVIQMFGMNENGEKVSIMVKDFSPYFYVKVGEFWTNGVCNRFLEHLKEKVGEYYANSILSCQLVERKTLYGFDAGKEYKFVVIHFKNTTIQNKVKKLWYKKNPSKNKDDKYERRVVVTYEFGGIRTKLFESKLPPLLRYFHIYNISPSGWIRLKNLSKSNIPSYKKTTCKYEYEVKGDNIESLPNKEDQIPLVICSFDIEASSSHGDFPLAVKKYEKFTIDLLNMLQKNPIGRDLFERIVWSAFDYDDLDGIHTVYPVEQDDEVIEEKVEKGIENILDITINVCPCGHAPTIMDTDKFCSACKQPSKLAKEKGFLDYLNNNSTKRENKFEVITEEIFYILPRLKGDEVTFIGSTFRRATEEKPYLNNCIAKKTCGNVKNCDIWGCNNEKEILLKWTKLIQKQDPDIIVGYNILGFDYKFMLGRIKELEKISGENLTEKFLQLSRIKKHKCKELNKEIRIASGTHKWIYPEIFGRLQIDLYNYFRTQYNFSSFKLDSVASELIGDKIKSFEYNKDRDETIIYSGNLTGLGDGNYIIIEEITHSKDLYKDGKKFMVSNVTKSSFTLKDKINPNMKALVRWCLAKDDITPQQIFEYSNGTPEEQALIAKYCIQDCNLVHHLMRKTDIITGFSEISNICSIPISFVVFRGQGIKLLSFIAKKCREKNTVMKTVEPEYSDGSYEGAICLPPKSDLYLNDPVACVDYGSLYPSSMISENLSHDSKVWTKSFDLNGNLIESSETGEKGENGEYKYDNLEGYTYVDVEYDRFKWSSKTPNGPKNVKKKVGTKICRFAQFPDGQRGIMPSILEQLLAARKATRALIKYKSVYTNDEEKYDGLLSKKNGKHIIKQKNGEIIEINDEDVLKTENTYDDFMKNIFNQRQLGYKVTANSLYGQCGAKTSDFYEQDIAAATTATGRKLLIFAKKVIENIYADANCQTKYGQVHTNAETVAGDTDSVFFTFHLTDMKGKKILGVKALEITIELAQEAGALVTKLLKAPHDLEYEKTFWPFCLLAKKKYVGMLYEFNPKKAKLKSMGIVLKRRDNAPIVKDIYGGVISILMKDKDVNKAVQFVKEYLIKISNGHCPMKKLIITKSLRGFYKNPKSIAHKVLADRIGKRDPGNKPSSGTRIPFVYIQTKGKKKLQGEKIETPSFILKNNLKIDYAFYITNQIMKPLLQVFGLNNVLYNIPDFSESAKNRLRNRLKLIKQNFTDDKFEKKSQVLKNKEIKRLIFDFVLTEIKNKKNGLQSINKFFSVQK